LERSKSLVLLQVGGLNKTFLLSRPKHTTVVEPTEEEEEEQEQEQEEEEELGQLC
jgi:hypothetical protein